MNEENVEYVILGGHAVIAHGFLRTTGDVDILVRPSIENAERLLTVMNRYGFIQFGTNLHPTFYARPS